ncbi:MAG: hypothetical protein ABJG42_24660 [Vibrio splendidus]
MIDINLPFGWDSAVEEAKKLNSNGALNNMVVAASIILELDSKLRPAEPAPQKTVADAWGWSDGEWAYADRDVITYSAKHGFSYSKESYSLDDGEKLVCTREQFEAYGREQEAKQEGEKWTHEYLWAGSWHKCTLLNEGKKDCDGYYAAINSGGGYILSTNIRPIKPTITKTEAKAVEDYVDWLANEKNIEVDHAEYLATREVK